MESGVVVGKQWLAREGKERIGKEEKKKKRIINIILVD